MESRYLGGALTGTAAILAAQNACPEPHHAVADQEDHEVFACEDHIVSPVGKIPRIRFHIVLMHRHEHVMRHVDRERKFAGRGDSGKCYQCGSVANPNVASFQLGRNGNAPPGRRLSQLAAARQRGPPMQGWGEASRRAEDGSPYRRQDGGSPCGSGRRQSSGLLPLKLLDDASLRHDRLVAAQVEDELLLPGEVSYRNHSNVWPILKSRIAGSSPVRSMTKSCVTLQMPTEASFSETSAWT